MMRAALLHTCGSPPEVGSRPVPTPAPDQVLVRVTAASITPLDVLCASGTSYFGAPAVPYVPGVQGVGELPDGSAVWFATTAGMRPGDGSMAEYAAVHLSDTVPLPSGADHRLVTALGLSAVAAYMSLTWRGGLTPGEDVLVLGGGGVVGQAAIQLAKLGGATRVVAACRSSAASSRAAQAGADALVSLTELGGPFDLVIDPLFGEPATAAVKTLRPGGRLVNLGSSAGETAVFDSATVRSGSLSILGYTNNSLSKAQRAAAITAIASHTAKGELTLDYEALPFNDIGEAWSRQSTGQSTRRLVVTFES